MEDGVNLEERKFFPLRNEWFREQRTLWGSISTTASIDQCTINNNLWGNECGETQDDGKGVTRAVSSGQLQSNPFLML